MKRAAAFLPSTFGSFLSRAGKFGKMEDYLILTKAGRFFQTKKKKMQTTKLRKLSRKFHSTPTLCKIRRQKLSHSQVASFIRRYNAATHLIRN